MAQSTSIQRIQRLIESVPLANLLLTLLSTAYRKVGMGGWRGPVQRSLGDRGDGTLPSVLSAGPLGPLCISRSSFERKEMGLDWEVSEQVAPLLVLGCVNLPCVAAAAASRPYHSGTVRTPPGEKQQSGCP